MPTQLFLEAEVSANLPISVWLAKSICSRATLVFCIHHNCRISDGSLEVVHELCSDNSNSFPYGGTYFLDVSAMELRLDKEIVNKPRRSITDLWKL